MSEGAVMSKGKRKIRARKQLRPVNSRVRHGVEKLEPRTAPGSFLDVLAGAAFASTADGLLEDDTLTSGLEDTELADEARRQSSDSDYGLLPANNPELKSPRTVQGEFAVDVPTEHYARRFDVFAGIGASLTTDLVSPSSNIGTHISTARGNSALPQSPPTLPTLAPSPAVAVQSPGTTVLNSSAFSAPVSPFSNPPIIAEGEDPPAQGGATEPAPTTVNPTCATGPPDAGTVPVSTTTMPTETPPDYTVNENAELELPALSGGAGGSWRIDWDDGSTDTYNPGDKPKHTWTDDATINTAHDDYAVKMTYTIGGCSYDYDRTVRVMNLAPEANDDAFAVDADQILFMSRNDVLGNDVDPSPDDPIVPIDYTRNGVTWGDVAPVTGGFKYWPSFLKDKLYRGHKVVESFKYKVRDDDLGTDWATIKVTVTGTEKHDKLVHWVVGEDLVETIHKELDRLNQVIKDTIVAEWNRLGLEGNPLSMKPFGTAQALLNFVNTVLTPMAVLPGSPAGAAQGVNLAILNALGPLQDVTVEGMLDGFFGILKDGITNLGDNLLPRFAGFIQDPILMGCNIVTEPKLLPGPPSLSGIWNFKLEYKSIGGRFTHREWIHEENNESHEEPGVNEKYKAELSALFSFGFDGTVQILGNGIRINQKLNNVEIVRGGEATFECDDNRPAPTI